MERSDEILQKAFTSGRGLTRSERGELREAYLYEQEQKQSRKISLDKKTVISKEDMLNLPRHKVNCPDFEECPLDYKCRNFNPKYMKCQNCILNQDGQICNTKLHTHEVLSVFIKRSRVNLDEEKS